MCERKRNCASARPGASLAGDPPGGAGCVQHLQRVVDLPHRPIRLGRAPLDGGQVVLGDDVLGVEIDQRLLDHRSAKVGRDRCLRLQLGHGRIAQRLLHQGQGIERSAIAGTLGQDPVGDLRGVLADGPRLVVAALDQESDSEPRAGIGVERGHVRVLDVAPAQLGRKLQGFSKGRHGLRVGDGGLQVAQCRQDLAFGLAGGRRRVRALRQRADDVGAALRQCRRLRILPAVENQRLDVERPREADDRRLGLVAGLALLFEDRDRLRGRLPGRVEVGEAPRRPRELHQRLGGGALRLRDA